MTDQLSVDQAMTLALEEAASALDHNDVPVGAVVLIDGRVVASRHNEREMRQDPTAHAEILALRDAAQAIGSWRLMDATMVVTLEPCAMCAGAAVSSRLGSLVFGAIDLKAGATRSLYEICTDSRLNHQVDVQSGVMANECGDILRTFFKARRRPPTEA